MTNLLGSEFHDRVAVSLARARRVLRLLVMNSRRSPSTLVDDRVVGPFEEAVEELPAAAGSRLLSPNLAHRFGSRSRWSSRFSNSRSSIRSAGL